MSYKPTRGQLVTDRPFFPSSAHRHEPPVPVVTEIIPVSEPESLTSSSEEEENRNDDTKLLSSVCCISSIKQEPLELLRPPEPRPPQTFILPRPTAVIMPVQLQVGPDSGHLTMATAKPTGLILVSDLCNSGSPRLVTIPKDSTKPKPLFPKTADGDIPQDELSEMSNMSSGGSRKSTVSIGTQTIGPFYRRKKDSQTQASKGTLKPITVQGISRLRATSAQLSPRARLKRQVTSATSVPADKRSRPWNANKVCELESALIEAAMQSEESTSLTTSHTETQTLSLWDDLQGALNESISTQTLDSFLADASCLTESGRQRVEQTKEELRRLAFPDTDTASQSVQTMSAAPDMSTMAIQTQGTDAMSVQTDTYGLPDLDIFTQGTQTISGRFVPLEASSEQFVQTQLTPVLSESIGIQAMEDLVSNSCQTLLGTTSSVQCGPDEPLAGPSRTMADCSMQTLHPGLDSSHQSLVSVATQNTPTKLSGLETVQRGCQISTAMEMSTTQTDADFLESVGVETQTTLDDLDLPELLTAASQTHPFDTEDMQTQTMDDMFDQLISNMHTQTSEDFLNDLGFDTLKSSGTTSTPDTRDVILDTDHSFSSYPLASSSLSSAAALGSLSDEMVLGNEQSLMDAAEQSTITGLEQQSLFPNFTLPLSHGKNECDN